jgi:thioredoxin-related protein
MRVFLLTLVSVCFITTGYSQSPVKWYTIEEAFALTQKEPRKIMIDVYTDWCGWCKVMDANTFSNEVIAAYLNKSFYPVKFNAEQKTDVTINGQVFKFVPNGTKGYNELAAALLNGQLSYPSVVFLDEKTQMIQPIQGYIQARQFDGIIKFIGGDRYKTEKWADFQSGYVSPIAETTTATEN